MIRSADVTKWRLWSLRREHRQAVDGAKKILETALALPCRFVASWSGGKDSTAMTHLIRALAPETQVMVQFDDCDWPEKEPYINRIAERFGWEYVRVQPDFSVFEAAVKYGLGTEHICAQAHPLTRDAFIAPLEAKRKELGCEGVYLGLRAQESRARRMNAYTRGPLYQKQDGTHVCLPLVRWSALDVFAYLVGNEIEINPCYLNNKFCAPEEVRISWALPTPGTHMESREHIRHYYPEQFRKLRRFLT